MFEITLKDESSYGRGIYHPDCNISKMIMKLMKKRETFTDRDLKIFRDSGWKVILT
jgi:hypothetical protein